MQYKSMPRKNTWSKKERLFRKKDIETLFQKGKAFSVPNIRVVYYITERPKSEWAPIRLGIVVLKKRFSKSVEGNKIKSWINEEWRINKHEMYSIIPENEQWHVFFIFASKKLPTFQKMEEAVMNILKEWKKRETHV